MLRSVCITGPRESGSEQGRWTLEYLSGKTQLRQAGSGESGHKVLALGDAPTHDGDEFSSSLASTPWPKAQGLARKRQKVDETDISSQASGMGWTTISLLGMQDMYGCTVCYSFV